MKKTYPVAIIVVAFVIAVVVALAASVVIFAAFGVEVELMKIT